MVSMTTTVSALGPATGQRVTGSRWVGSGRRARRTSTTTMERAQRALPVIIDQFQLAVRRGGRVLRAIAIRGPGIGTGTRLGVWRGRPAAPAPREHLPGPVRSDRGHLWWPYPVVSQVWRVWRRMVVACQRRDPRRVAAAWRGSKAVYGRGGSVHPAWQTCWHLGTQ